MNATTEEVLEEILENNGDFIDVRMCKKISFITFFFLILQNGITVVNNLLSDTNAPGWHYLDQVH